MKVQDPFPLNRFNNLGWQREIILLYGAETLRVTKNITDKFETLGNKFLRSVLRKSILTDQNPWDDEPRTSLL